MQAHFNRQQRGDTKLETHLELFQLPGKRSKNNLVHCVISTVVKNFLHKLAGIPDKARQDN